MPGGNEGDVHNEMSVLKGPIHQPARETAAGSDNFRDRFASIVAAYDDERTWWTAVNDLLDRDGDFAADVSCVYFCISASTDIASLIPVCVCVCVCLSVYVPFSVGLQRSRTLYTLNLHQVLTEHCQSVLMTVSYVWFTHVHYDPSTQE